MGPEEIFRVFLQSLAICEPNSSHIWFVVWPGRESEAESKHSWTIGREMPITFEEEFFGHFELNCSLLSFQADVAGYTS